ncbi:methyltransferase domain-containing protein [Sphingobacterium prati]|uniref:methyltransferase domain-containing protein n=1 Tax=Sphingobacterium prati TaxID=2737006 RepID=UPI001557597F|nr:methyltransferase domain-containing protein [Sphingobacterium prati]NPE45966.1 methyltransferase domain-containing protein [Sphingobacterium prati]
MRINTKFRTEHIEIMDDFSLEGEELQLTLNRLSKINKFLGGNNITLDGVKKLLSKTDISKTVTVLDIGCGGGDMLRMLSDFGAKNNIDFKMHGIDANYFTITYAQGLSTGYPNISYSCRDVLGKDFSTRQYDIVLCTLTLHHFGNEQIIDLMGRLANMCKLGIIVNDLQRSKIAYRLFQTICVVFRLNRMTREDGLVSILRGFKKCELEQFAEKLHLKNYSIQWKWAFRYQWIISHI